MINDAVNADPTNIFISYPSMSLFPPSKLICISVVVIFICNYPAPLLLFIAWLPLWSLQPCVVPDRFRVFGWRDPGGWVGGDRGERGSVIPFCVHYSALFAWISCCGGESMEREKENGGGVSPKRRNQGLGLLEVLKILSINTNPVVPVFKVILMSKHGSRHRHFHRWLWRPFMIVDKATKKTRRCLSLVLWANVNVHSGRTKTDRKIRWKFNKLRKNNNNLMRLVWTYK